MSGMDIGVNVLWLRPGEVGGTESYARRVLRALSQHAPDLRLHLFGTAAGVGAVRPVGATVEEYITAAADLPPRRRIIVERTWLRSVVGPPLDLLHHPGGTVPFAKQTPTLVTIHDLQPLVDPSNFSTAKRRFLSRAIPASVERASVIATPSDFVRNDILNRFDVLEDRVVTVSAFAEPPDLSHEPEPTPRLARILVKGPVLFYPAMTMRHKNHSMLFEAFRRAVQRDADLQLVCVGAVGRYHDQLVELAAIESPSIHLLGHVSREDLDTLFVRSEALLFPSTYEGFGLPIIEAQQLELPVVSSNTAALPEVAGDGAVLLDPQDVDAWAEVMVSRWSSTERAGLVAAGRTNALRYSAERTAEQQGDAYRRCAA